jgi:iron(III) transport system substrate-binding protein
VATGGPRTVAIFVCLLLCGCWFSSGPEVVVYSALDREFSEPILDQFTAETGVKVLASYDVESTKTIGLTSQIMAEAQRPRCDLFWNNEILNTLRLEKQGLLEVYFAPEAKNYPPQFVSPQGRWHGFAARVRVLIVNTKKVPRDEWPTSINDFVDPKWKGQVGIAKPLFGTTATHAACLFAHWGDEDAQAFFLKLKDNAKILSGNKQVALAVAAGELAFGLTDTDDAYIEKVVKKMPVEIVVPDQGEDQIGALFIPNTLAIVKGGPHPQQARRLVDYLLSAEVESRLAASQSAQFPLHAKATATSPAAGAAPLKRMEVDFPAAAAKWDAAAEFLKLHFATAGS